MPGQAALGQFVVVVPAPAEFMHQRRQHQRTVCDTAGDNDVGTLFQGRHQAGRTQIGVQAHHHGGEGLTGGHFSNAGIAQLFLFHQQIIAEHQRNLQIDAGLFTQGLQSIAASHRVYSTGIGQNPDAFILYLAEQRRHHRLHKIPGVALSRVFHLLAGHDRHGDLGQVIGDQVINIALAYQLGSGGFGIAPESGGATDTDGFVGV